MSSAFALAGDRRTMARRTTERRQPASAWTWLRMARFLRQAVAPSPSVAQQIAAAYARGRADERDNWQMVRDELAAYRRATHEPPR